MTDYLIKSFDITEELIKNNNAKENEIIANYNNFIISTNNSYTNKQMVRSATYTDSDIPYDININNNFQHYNDTNDSGYFMPNKINNYPIISTPIGTTAPAGTTAPTRTNQGFKDYFKDLREGFKDYYAFNN